MSIQTKAELHLIGPLFSPRQGDTKTADNLLGGGLRIRSMEPFDISGEIDWSADPYVDRNWQFIFHSLRWLDPVRRAAIATNQNRYKEFYENVLKSWIDKNIETEPKSSFAWYDMSSGIRVNVIAAAISFLGPKEWLVNALRAHVDVMSSPAFGAKKGNHALHVRIGLLIAANLLENDEIIQSAKRDIEMLFKQDIDDDGVDFEGGMQYQRSNYLWYKEAELHLDAAGEGSSLFKNVLSKMPDFLAHSTNTLGRPVQFGDSDPVLLTGIESDYLEYIRSAGKRGTRPQELYMHYRGGYTFGRTNWDMLHERQGLFYSLRHGPASGSQPHADNDGASLTLSYQGNELLFESGRYRYDNHPMSKYLKSNKAHNSIIIGNESYSDVSETRVINSEHSEFFDWTVVERTESKGSIWKRGVYHHRRSQSLIVLDRVACTDEDDISQHWQLGVNTSVHFSNKKTSVCNGNQAMLNMAWLSNSEQTSSVICGEDADLLGWRSVKYAEYFEAPILRVRARSKILNTVTVLSPVTRDDDVLHVTSLADKLDDCFVDLPIILRTRGSAYHFNISMNDFTLNCRELR